MEALVITLREGIEAALVLGIILAYLRKTGRRALNGFVYVGLALAIAASLGMAAFLQALGLDPENEYLEGALLGLGGLFVGSMVLWMWRTARSLRRQMESRLASLTAEERRAGWGVGLGLLLFTFVMVFREGMETVLFLAAVSLGEAASLWDFLGGAAGLGLATLFAVLFIRGSLRINLARFFAITGSVLLVLAARLLAASAHEFAEVGLLPLTKEIMALLGYFVRDNSVSVLVMALVAVPVFLLLWETAGAAWAAAGPSGESAPERRKRLAAARLELVWQGALAAATLLIVLSLATTALAGERFVDPPPTPVEASNGEVRIPLGLPEEGRLNKFSYRAGGVAVRFLVVRLQDGTLGVALDACQICGAVGYGQEGKNAICKNCNAPIAMNTLGQGGGCNPRELPARLDGAELVISAADLAAAQAYFR